LPSAWGALGSYAGSPAWLTGRRSHCLIHSIVIQHWFSRWATRSCLNTISSLVTTKCWFDC